MIISILNEDISNKCQLVTSSAFKKRALEETIHICINEALTQQLN